MDIIREKKGARYRKWWYLPLILGGGAAVFVASSVIGTADYRVNARSLQFGTVTQGNFDVVVRAPGKLVATDVRWLATEVDGRVERVLAKPGTLVREGDAIAELSNPRLVQQLEELQWDLEAQAAENRAETRTLESLVLDQQAATLTAEADYKTSLMAYQAQTLLRDRNQGSLSDIDYESLRLRTQLLKESWGISQSQSANIAANVEAQIAARDARIKKLEKQIARAQQQVSGLTIRAGMDSVVQEIPIEPGQQLPLGANIAKLVRQNQLIAQMQISELQIRDVAIDQPANIDTRRGKIAGRVSRIAPSVVNGSVEVDIEFTEATPPGVRPDLAVEAEILVASSANALFVERPAYSQSNRQMRIFRLTPDQQYAEQVLVEFGRGSVRQIQILEGLSVGDRVITSDQSDFEGYSRIRLTQ